MKKGEGILDDGSEGGDFASTGLLGKGRGALEREEKTRKWDWGGGGTPRWG